MNTDILEQYGLELRRNSYGDHEIIGHWLGSYISIFRCIENVERFIFDLDLAIAGNFSQIEDPDWSAWLGFQYFAEIRPNEFAIWGENMDENDAVIISLVNMRSILQCWKEFLEKK